jgi:hypothetical protein
MVDLKADTMVAQLDIQWVAVMADWMVGLLETMSADRKAGVMVE